jgi:hypothetical protein
LIMPCEGKVDATILIGAYDSGRGGQFGLRWIATPATGFRVVIAGGSLARAFEQAMVSHGQKLR